MMLYSLNYNGQNFWMEEFNFKFELLSATEQKLFLSG